MNQLPIFVTLGARKVILIGDGEAADAKRRLIERAGGLCVAEDAPDAMLAFVAIEDTQEAAKVADRVKARGLLVNVVDQPALCDFTTPAIIDRDPVLLAIGTGGASAGLAKAVRQRLEAILPAGLGPLAKDLQSARDALRATWPNNAARRKAIDAALSEAGILDPLADHDEGAVDRWLQDPETEQNDRLEVIKLRTLNPDDLTLKQARLLGQADHIFHDPAICDVILNRARADAVRHIGNPPALLPSGLVLHMHLDIDHSVQKARR
jgi:uroporphyrin-III C-methyltransferase / precorrin-2 dehydrogenase / sirohydrochlorin ferrochelatase